LEPEGAGRARWLRFEPPFFWSLCDVTHPQAPLLLLWKQIRRRWLRNPRKWRNRRRWRIPSLSKRNPPKPRSRKRRHRPRRLLLLLSLLPPKSLLLLKLPRLKLRLRPRLNHQSLLSSEFFFPSFIPRSALFSSIILDTSGFRVIRTWWSVYSSKTSRKRTWLSSSPKTRSDSSKLAVF